MSFILDALRKSEHQRQKSTGPGLAEIPVAAPRTKTNVWATAAVTLLVVNLTAVGVLLLRRADSPESPAAAATPAATPGADAREPAATTAAAPVANPTLAPPPQSPTTAAATPPQQRPVDPGRNPLAEEVGDAAPGLEPGMADAAASVPEGPPAVARQGAPKRGGSVVYAPVPEANDAPYSPPEAEPELNADPVQPPAPSRSALPGADEMVARGMPALHLDLHVYSNVPKQRFIFVNSRKYLEGDTLQEGAVVESITPDGAVLSFRGSRFKLSH